MSFEDFHYRWFKTTSCCPSTCKTHGSQAQWHTFVVLLLNYDVVGNTLQLRAILEGLVVGQLHPRFTKGLRVLLAKKVTSGTLVNSHPPKLLNLN